MTSMNAGINAAKGKYIMRMDADDIMMKDHIKLQAKIYYYAKEIEKRYSQHIEGDVEPRFSLKHIIKSDKSIPRTILLYILPLDDENQIHFNGGKFVTPEEIEADKDQYSSFLKEEVEHLDVVPQM